MRHWQAARAARAVAWLSGVTPALQSARISMGTSGKKARSSIALEITQMSVQSPQTRNLSAFRPAPRRASPAAKNGTPLPGRPV